MIQALVISAGSLLLVSLLDGWVIPRIREARKKASEPEIRYLPFEQPKTESYDTAASDVASLSR